jgi:hypothetical protein
VILARCCGVIAVLTPGRFIAASKTYSNMLKQGKGKAVRVLKVAVHELAEMCHDSGCDGLP